MKEPYLAHSDLTGAIYIVVGKDKFDVAEQAKKAVKAVNKGHWIMTGDYYTGAYESIDYVECSCCHEHSLEEEQDLPSFREMYSDEERCVLFMRDAGGIIAILNEWREQMAFEQGKYKRKSRKKGETV